MENNSMHNVDSLFIPKPILLYCCNCDNHSAPQLTNCSNCKHIFCKKIMTIENKKIICGQGKYNVSVVWTYYCSLLYIIAGLGNNVGVSMMGYEMVAYPEFLLYGTTLMYTLMFALFAIITKQNFNVSWKQHKIFLWLGLWTSLNGVLSQYAIPLVAPELTGLLTQISLPITWISSWYMFRWRVTRATILFAFVIIFGIIFGIVPSLIYGSGNNSDIGNHMSPFWIIITIISAIPTAFETTYQEKAFKYLNADLFVALTYYNFYSLIVYAAALPLTMTDLMISYNYTSGLELSEVIPHQIDSFKCFFGDHSVYMCGSKSTIWVLVFTIGYVCQFSIGALLLKVKSSNHIANLNALLTPITAMIFWIRPIVGSHGQDPVWWVFISVIIILFGNIFYDASNTDSNNSYLSNLIRLSCLDKTVNSSKNTNTKKITDLNLYTNLQP